MPPTQKRIVGVLLMAQCTLMSHLRLTSAFVPLFRGTVQSVVFKALPGLDELESSYAEQSRPCRRDFYNYESWLRHRSPKRFADDLLNLSRSGVARQILRECLRIGLLTTFICLFNSFCSVGWDDLSGIHHQPFVDLQTLKLPLQPFVLSSPALGLLLVLRTNVSYQRWDEARKAWGVVVNNSRTIARQTSVWIKFSDMPFVEKQRLLKRTSDAIWAFPRSLARHLLSEKEDELDYCDEVRKRLDEPFASELIRWRRHRPSRALFEMSNAINELPFEAYRRIAVDESVSHLCDAMGGCDRVSQDGTEEIHLFRAFLYPYPTSPCDANRFIHHQFRWFIRDILPVFLELWLLFLPLALWDVLAESWNHWATIPVSVAINYFFLGIEELSVQLEEPFSMLPLHQLAAGIGKSADEHFAWNEKDYERSWGSANELIMEHDAGHFNCVPFTSLQQTTENIATVNGNNMNGAPPSPVLPVPAVHTAPQHDSTPTDQYASLTEAYKAMTKGH